MPNQDYETLGGVNPPDTLERDDFPSIFVDLIRGINWKISFFLFIFAVFIFSDLFIDSVLILSNGSVEAGCPTTKGTIVQIIFLVMSYIFIDVLARADVI